MKLYNTSSRKLETFSPIDPTNVKVYTCGPTVYDYAHVGNLTSYIYWDLLVRTLTANGYKVNRILNLTDVGHLASDADDGIDKLEKGAAREHKTVWEIAKTYSDFFLKDFRALKLTEPTKICPATKYIEQDQKLIDLLTKKGYTYETKDGIYFDTSKFPRYADFAHLDLEHLKAGARVDFNSEKKSVSDFALWKYIQPDEDHAMRWQYRGKDGYPGWHIECSTIIHEELGETIDIHTGGIDHIPIHHTNEIAQSESAFDKKLSNFWLHCNFITIENQKVSKSLGNTYTLKDLEGRNISPLDFKMWVLSGHYQGTRNFSFEDLLAAKNRRLNWRNAMVHCYQQNNTTTNTDVLPQVIENLSNNLNSAAAFAVIDEAIKSPANFSVETWQKIDDLFGLDLTSKDISEETKALIKEREAARNSKDYTTSDRIRDELASQNLTILDSPSGSIWQYIS